MPHMPNGEMVAKAWFLGVTGVPANGVATTLPENQSAFPNGFVVVGLTGGDPQMHMLKRESILDVAVWAPPRTPGGNRPQWNMAANLGELLVKACYDDDVLNVQRTLTMPDGFYDARILSLMPSELVRRGSDANSNACFGFDLQMHWITLS